VVVVVIVVAVNAVVVHVAVLEQGYFQTKEEDLVRNLWLNLNHCYP